MPLYEFTFIAQQGLTQYELEGLVKGLSSLLTKNGAELLKYEYWGLLDFAYTIDKMNKGHYCMIYIKATPSSMDEFKRKVRLNEDILRFLCLKKDKLPKGDSLMIQASQV
ncbi:MULTISPECIES: 30S ribosomal protein S6 [Ehrlichia]|uniref:Small ribosomal subunit protein bS6 n=3 Tax=canis group TaxID=106178 RepID=RS6_EHRCR|nr:MULTISPECIES: 30S ribosomal protein S6 [Ehrlichia]Q2GHF4.1 RecName: Full=Small ribosomal subunit protein bS6; AltName: Full=30S ribosomal protein S6 [Ehrlichia chaffeensis str. Arkansas]ABD45370.1 ribosomal protein S6 [Ehrlichia chaffeensis str. Arkansas]AHC39460.1 30S ribosomal protein S6 [Ehrlichia muris AS145]AHX03423.1 ribosomal protein S6 [Ehrlichia chaffeensis str. Heartland]AHX05856.1 ribosomal protein S6 [Ehrlichia chaffeensis str. Jax]AHX06847.1 ribosomal protein S6 [Ehrlichia cha